MDKRLRKLVQPSFGLFFILFFFFSFACAYYSVALMIAGIALNLVMFTIYRLYLSRRKRALSEYLTNLDLGVSGSRNTLVNFPLPALVALSTTGEILWCNNLFEDIAEREEIALNLTMEEIAPDFDGYWLKEGKQQSPSELKIGNKYFNVYGCLIRDDKKTTGLMTLYFVETTEFIELKTKYAQTRPVLAIISIDNYEELTKNVTDSEKSAIIAEVDKKINDWQEGNGTLLRKYDRDKYIFVMEEQNLEKFEADKFSILDEVRKIQNREGIIATLSIGIGKDGVDFEENYRFCGLALEMSLSRGGDQAVIKNRYAFEFFGGLSQEVEKRTKVKIRVVANALGQLIRDSSQVLVMGHSMSDADSLGAAVGMVCATRSREKPVHIVIDEEKTLATKLLERIKNVQAYENIFISTEEAMVMCDSNTLLIIVDTNRPDYVESPSLLQSINKVAVIDHHRRAADYIQDSALNLHEPYASSACELVSELLQYMVPNKTIMREEAECLLAGIYLDTKGFSIKAGVRTFEAAAYLKRAGADMISVKQIFLSSFDEYMKRQAIIASAKNLGNGCVMAISNSETDRATAAKAADELLNIVGVQASFVAYKLGTGILISARSLGEINVQLIMEKLGGGGAQASAGAQIQGLAMNEVQYITERAVNEYFDSNKAH